MFGDPVLQHLSSYDIYFVTVVFISLIINLAETNFENNQLFYVPFPLVFRLNLCDMIILLIL